MNENFVILLPILLPILTGVILLCLPRFKSRKAILGFSGVSLVLSMAILFYTITCKDIGYTFFNIIKEIPIFFTLDALGKIFAVIISVAVLGTFIYATIYMKHENNEKMFFGFYLIVYGVLIGASSAGNIITLYMFYELMTLLSMPLVIHTLKREAIMASLKYLFYSFCGAYMALFGILILQKYTDVSLFVANGSIDITTATANQGIIFIAIFLMILGFGVKAGVFPMHGWLPTAHPVAPSPASAILSAIIAKIGVLAIIRTIFYLVGPNFIRGTWVQYAWMILSLVTVFLGSMLAYREKIIKKRFAYSTVSQISYILLGLSLLTEMGFVGSILHVVFHAFIKTALFLVAGAIIFKTGKTKCTELKGIGKEMPVTIWCFTIISLGLIGIPFTSGFISKWYLAVGALNSQIHIIAYLAPVVLLVSACLTAGYLLPISIKGFFVGDNFDYSRLKKNEPHLLMVIPIMLFTAITVFYGMFPNQLVEIVSKIATEIF